LQTKDVSFNEYEAKLIVKGKADQRIIPIFCFVKLLRQFIEAHLSKNNPKAPLFYRKNRKGMLVPLKCSTFRMRLKRFCERIGVTKRIHTRLFKHTRLTELVKELSEQVLKQAV
jgi:site-specific recombinase XerD